MTPVRPAREGTLAHRFGNVGFGVHVVPGKRVEPERGTRGRVLVKIVGRGRGLDSNYTWVSFGAGVKSQTVRPGVRQSWGLLGAGPCWGRALDGGGGKLRSRVVARIRPGV